MLIRNNNATRKEKATLPNTDKKGRCAADADGETKGNEGSSDKPTEGKEVGTSEVDRVGG